MLKGFRCLLFVPAVPRWCGQKSVYICFLFFSPFRFFSFYLYWARTLLLIRFSSCRRRLKKTQNAKSTPAGSGLHLGCYEMKVKYETVDIWCSVGGRGTAAEKSSRRARGERRKSANQRRGRGEGSKRRVKRKNSMNDGERRREIEIGRKIKKLPDDANGVGQNQQSCDYVRRRT